MEEPADTTRPVLGSQPREPEAMDPQIRSIQPGGGTLMDLELAWGRVRRWWLRTFRSGYVRRMAELRQGDFNPAPHEVLDPRDLKYHSNLGGWHWKPEDDPFRWRERIPFARVGLAELLFFSAITFGPALLLMALILEADLEGALSVVLWLIVDSLLVTGGLIVWFFRDPDRPIPTAEGAVVSPADGTIAVVQEIEHDPYIGGRAVQINIFLSIFNVHVNRSSRDCRVIGLTYKRGKFLNALKPESVQENEQLEVRLQETAAPHRPLIIRQIAGAIARRIVCWLKPGDLVARGERFGMIKFGSRTELVLPHEEGLLIAVRPGDKVKGGKTVLARFTDLASSRAARE